MMNDLNVLYIEDEPNDVSTFESTVKRYNKENSPKQVNYSIVSNLDEAKSLLSNRDNFFDGIIIDIRLNNVSGKGNETIDILQKYFLRIPCVAYTGTPDDVNNDLLLKKFTKSSSSLDEVFEYLFSIQKTGIVELLGGAGILEKYLSQIYDSNIKPNICRWINYSETNQTETAKALLRFVVHGMSEILMSSSKSVAEEMYIKLPAGVNLRTGCILTSKESKKNFIVLSPACDLEIRDGGNPNTDCIILVEIEPFTSAAGAIFMGEETNNKKDKRNNLRNNSKICYHYLPKCNFFSGGLINFRKVVSAKYDEHESKYDVGLKITAPFIKDISARFSSYYARQGQPDLCLERLCSEII